MEQWLSNPKNNTRGGSRGSSRNASMDFSANENSRDSRDPSRRASMIFPANENSTGSRDPSRNTSNESLIHSRNTSNGSLHYMAVRNSTGFVLSSDALDRMGVVARQYERDTSTSSHHRSNSIHSAGSFQDMTQLDSNNSTSNHLSQQYDKLQLMIKEQQQKSSQRSRSDSIRSAGSFTADMTMFPQDCNNSVVSLVDMALLLHECDDDVKTTNSKSQSVGLLKLGYGSGTTSGDEEHTSMSSIKPRPPSEHDSLTPREKPGQRSSSIVVVDKSHLNTILELEQYNEHTLRLSKLGHDSGATGNDEHTSMSSIKPRPPSEHDSLTPKEKPRPHSSSIVVVDNSPLNPVSELERVDILRSAKSPSSLRLLWSTCFARYCECFAP